MTAQRKKQKRVGFILLNLISFLFIISFASATITTDPSSVFLTPTQTSQLVEFINSNSTDTSTYPLSLSSDLTNVVSLSFNNIIFPSNRYITISVKSTAPAGTHNGYLNFGTYSLPITVYVENTTIPVEESEILVFPTSKVVTVQQGNEKSQNILITVPSTYPRSINIQSVDFYPGTETILFGDLNLGLVSPGQSVQIPIVFSGKDAETGSYNTNLKIFATDSLGQVPMPTISLTLQVTSGISAVTGETFSSPPSCALSATTLNLNQTYTFTCSNTVANLDIEITPTDYIVGKKVDTTSGIYRYDFSPVKLGETSFRADFKYKGAPIFEPFKSDLRITSSGAVNPGTTLKFIFTPTLSNLKVGEPTLIQIVDNKTGSLVNSPKLFIDAKEINISNSAFEFTPEPKKEYTFRGVASGYDDLTETVKYDPKSIKISFSPVTGDISTRFNITTDVQNVTLLVGGLTYPEGYYGTLRAGLNEIKASKDGYDNAYVNITVEDVARVFGGLLDFKRGDEKTITLSKNVSTFRILYQEKLEDVQAEYFIGGAGNSFNFTPKKVGYYTIEADGQNIGTVQIKGFRMSDKWWIMPAWLWISIVALILIVFIITSGSRGRGSDDFGEGHLTYPVGGG